MDKLEELRNVIKQWNANRLDLFEISEPNKELEFHGVMRFYFQDAGQKVATKCIRVSSTASTNDVILILIEKFRPDIRMLTPDAEYALYEIHENGEERKLDNIEKPLVVQLNWNKDDREGRFLLRRMNEKTIPGFNGGSKGSNVLNGKSSEDNTFKRKLSKRDMKKEKKKKEKEGKSNDDDSKEKLAEKLYNELPETSFTRSISNPEAVMRRRRKQKLEKKLQQLVNEGGSEAGGTLRIFGEKLNKDAPYKTLLLSTKENSQYVIKEILEKYGLEKENPNDYCLVQLIVPPNLANLDKDLDLNTIQNLSENIKEYILDDEDCPLIIERLHNKNLGILTFHIRKKPENYTPQKRKKGYLDDDEDFSPYFVELNPQDGKPMRKHILTHTITEVGCSNAPNSNVRGKQQNDRQHLHLIGGNVQPKHCVITYLDGIVTVTPDPEAETFVNNLKITDSYILKHGMVVRFGKLHTFNFIDPMFEKQKNQLSPDLLNQMQNHAKLNSVNNGYLHEPQHNDDQLSSYSKKSDQQVVQSQIDNSPPPSQLHQQLKKCESILPAILELWEETEDPFLNSIITNVDVNQVQFKLAPTYTLYLAIRYRASTQFRPTATVEERAVRLTEFTNKFCQMIKYVIHINNSDQSRLAFWLANSSELLHFLKQDRHLSAFTVDGQELLAESVQIAFKKLVTCLEMEMENSMINMLSESEQEAATAFNKMLNVLNAAMTLLRNCRVNAALTIQMFSQIFHYINMHIFNQFIGVNRNENASSININYCTENWGMIIKQRLMQIISWAKKQGLELAADCYLNTIFQAATLLQSIKSQSLDNLGQVIKTQCYKLNSVQLRYILQQFERSSLQQYIPQHLIEQLVEVAEQTSDQLALKYGREICLAEESDLHLAFSLPEDGYFCDTVKGVPQGLQEFILPMVVHKLCNIAIQPTSAGHWTIFLNDPNNISNNSASNLSIHNSEQNNISKSNMVSPINKPSVLPGLQNINNVFNQDVSAVEPTTPTVNMMNHPSNWSMNNSQQQQMPPHFLIAAGTVPQRTVSTSQLAIVGGVGTGIPAHLQQNYVAAQPIYGQQPAFVQQNQLNLIQQQQQAAFAQQQQQQSKQQPELTTIKLKKGNHGMGLSIVAARGSPQEQFGIYIKSVVQGGAADMDGRLKAGDQLLKVDSNSLIGISQEKAAELMTQTGSIVTLEVAKAAAHYNGLASFLHNNNNSPRLQALNKNNQLNNRIVSTMHSANPLIPKSQTTEHLKQHSASLVNLHPYSTYPYPQQNIHQQQQLALMQQQLAIQQQQAMLQQQQQAINVSRPSSQMIMQPPTLNAQQFQAQKRLSTSTMNEDPRNYQPTYQNISLYQQQRMNASQNALYNPNPTIEQQLIPQPQFSQNYSMSQTNLSNTLRSQPQHYSSVSQLSASTTQPTNTSSMPSWATLPHGRYQSQQQQMSNQQQRNQQQQMYLRNQQQQRIEQEEKLNKLKMEQRQQFANEQDELLDESQSSISKTNENWQQQQLLQKTQEEQEERLQKLKLEESKLKEEHQVAEQVEERLIHEARKRKEDPLKHYGQQQQQPQSSDDTDNSDGSEGITIQQQQKLERLLSRTYQQSQVSSNGVVTLPPLSSHSNTTTNTISTNNQITNNTSSHQRNLSSSNVQSTSSLQNLTGIQSKSALRNPNKDSETNGEINGINKVNINKKVSWNVDNAIIIHNDEDELEDEDDGEMQSGKNYEDDSYSNCNTIINLNENSVECGQSTKEKIENSFTLQDIDEVLGTSNETDDDFSNPNQPNNTPNVIGAQEVYRDPRERIKAEKMKQQNNAQWVSEVCSANQRIIVYRMSDMLDKARA